MKSSMKKLLFLLLILSVLLSFCACMASSPNGTEPPLPAEYTRLSLFCDVNFWKPPQWETEKGSIMGTISEKTGAMVDVTVPAQDAIPLLMDGKDYNPYTLEFLQASFGMAPVAEDGSYRSPILQPETKEALAFLNQAVREGYASPEQMTWQNLKVKDSLPPLRTAAFRSERERVSARAFPLPQRFVWPLFPTL